MLRVRERGAHLSERWHEHGDRAFRLSRSLISTLQNRRRLGRVAFGRVVRRSSICERRSLIRWSMPTGRLDLRDRLGRVELRAAERLRVRADHLVHRFGLQVELGVGELGRLRKLEVFCIS